MGEHVSEVLEEARRMGWKEGDIIEEVNGQTVSGLSQLTEAVSQAIEQHRITGKPLVFKVRRKAMTIHAVPVHSVGEWVCDNCGLINTVKQRSCSACEVPGGGGR